MFKAILLVLVLFAILFTTIPEKARANPVEIFSEAWAEDCGRFTVAPDNGETLVDAQAGNSFLIHLRIWDTNGDPLVGIPPTDFALWHDELATCPGIFSQADGPTDAEGRTTFSGTIHAGMVGDASDGVDCDMAVLKLYLWGMVLNDDNPVCVATDSPDLNGDLQVTIPDFARFVQDFNCESLGIPCDPCHDFNEDHRTDVADLAIFADYFNASVCP